MIPRSGAMRVDANRADPFASPRRARNEIGVACLTAPPGSDERETGATYDSGARSPVTIGRSPRAGPVLACRRVNTKTVPTSRIRLVLVDDHPVVREGLRTLLTEEVDLELVAEARNTDEAVKLVVSRKADVVLMDLMMPGDDGIEGIRKVRAARPGTQVVVLTSFGDETRVRAALEAGAIGYLLKDVLKDELLRAIRSAALGQPTLDPVAQKHLLNRVRRSEERSNLDTLTPRELSILERIGRGWNNQAIAQNLNLTHGTVKGHVSRILDKLGVADRTQAALLAVREGVVSSAESTRT